jgi:hypothetical protein
MPHGDLTPGPALTGGTCAGWSHFAQFTIAVVNKDPKKSKYSGMACMPKCSWRIGAVRLRTCGSNAIANPMAVHWSCPAAMTRHVVSSSGLAPMLLVCANLYRPHLPCPVHSSMHLVCWLPAFVAATLLCSACTLANLAPRCYRSTACSNHRALSAPASCCSRRTARCASAALTCRA